MNVFWTRGTRVIGGKVQLGVAVLRPGWFAFLPLFAPVGGVGIFNVDTGGLVRGASFRMDVAWQGKYPMQAWWQAGERAFDENVTRAAHAEGGFVIQRAQGEIARTRHATMFQTADGPLLSVSIAEPPPPYLTEGWAPGVAPFDAKQTAAVFAVISAVLVLFATGCAVMSIVEDEPLGLLGTAFWLGLCAFVWIVFFVRRAEHRRALQAKKASRRTAPYR